MTATEQSLMAVFHSPGQAFDLVECSIPEPQAGQVLVKVSCCTVCGSDLHSYTGRRSTPTPTVLGHEIIGTVHKTGPTTNNASSDWPDGLTVGDRISWSIAASCGGCRHCSHGRPQKCDSLFKYGHEDLNLFALSGGLSQFCLLQAGTKIVRVAPEIPDSVACPANCATATVAAAFRSAGSVEGKRILIFGAGMLGLTACAFASVNGASEIAVCDINKERLQQANHFGATTLSIEPDAAEYDVVLELSGSHFAVERAINSTAIGAVVVLVGSVSPSPAVEVDPERIVRRLISIHGVHNYIPDDLVTALDFLSKHHAQFPFESLVEKAFELADVSEAFRFAESQRPVRVAVIP